MLVAASSDGATLVVSVRDSGPGIPTEDLARIFEAGVRLDNTRPGSGLGLAVTRAIAEAHDGTLGVESIAGSGTAFNLALPVDPG